MPRRFAAVPVPSRARRSAVALSLVALALGLGGCAPEPSPPRNLLLITIDTLRADRLGAYGNPRMRTPTLDRIAAGGALFCDASAQIPSTLPSHASILTGLYPTAHGVHDNGVYFLDPAATTLAEILAEFGFDTGAFVSAFVLDRRFGIDQGFATYGDAMQEPLRPGAAPELPPGANPVASWWLQTWYGPYQRRGESAVAEAIEWLDARGENAARPFFLWVHLFDPHEPYDPPAPFERLYDRDYSGAMDGTGVRFHEERAAGRVEERDLDHMRARYDGEVSYADRCVSELLEAIDSRGLREQTLVALTADHGEGMGEHGYYFEHGSRLWEPLLRVPLLLNGPGIPGGELVGGRVRSVDLLPTLLESLGFAPPEGIDGVSLVARLRGEGTERSSYAETQCNLQAMPVGESLRALTSGRWKLIATTSRVPAEAGRPPHVSLFDLQSDAAESRNIAAERPAVARDILRRIEEQASREAGGASDVLNTRAMDPETVAKLKALGYIR